MTGRLDGKVAVITGGASGLGTARRFVAEGAAGQRDRAGQHRHGDDVGGEHRRPHTAIDAATKAIAAGSPLGIPGLPEDIANAALYLASDEARYVTGTTLVVDAGMTVIGGSPRFHQQRPVLVREAGIREERELREVIG